MASSTTTWQNTWENGRLCLVISYQGSSRFWSGCYGQRRVWSASRHTATRSGPSCTGKP